MAVRFKQEKNSIAVVAKEGRIDLGVNTPTTQIYTGEYNIIPNDTTQTLNTANRLLIENIVIKPIPNNYGLITYNGFGITVS